MSYGNGNVESRRRVADVNYHTIVERWTGAGDPPDGKDFRWVVMKQYCYLDVPLQELAFGYAPTVEQAVDDAQVFVDEYEEA